MHPIQKIEIIPHQHEWQTYFQEEAKRLHSELNDFIVCIYHIGSTAIPGMPAKPVIDILMECHDLDAINPIAEKLQSLGYLALCRHTTPHRSYFTKCISDDMTYHLHIRETGDPQIHRHLIFKDFVTAHADDAKQYANLKMQLAKQHSYDRLKYTAGKEKLIQHICAKAKKWADKNKKPARAQHGPQASAWTKEKIIKSMEANINLHATHFAQFIDTIELIRVPGYTLINTCLADADFNIVLDTHVPPETADEKIKEILQIINSQPYPFSWLVEPYAEPANLKNYLQKFSIVDAKNYLGLYCDLDNFKDNQSSHELLITQISERKGFYDFAKLDPVNVAANEFYFFQVAEIYDELDPFEYFVGYNGDKPVVRGALVYGAQVVGIYHLHATEKKYEKILLQFLLQHAKNSGFHIATILISSEVEKKFHDYGFETAAKFYKYNVP